MSGTKHLSTLPTLFGFLVVVLMYSCSSKPNEPTDTPTSGTVNMYIDESFKTLFAIQEYTFEYLYKNADVHIQHMPEAKLVEQLLNDSCKVIALGRDLTVTEKKQFEKQNLFPVSTKIAEDAIVLICNKDNPIDSITLTHIKAILLGKDSVWYNAKTNITTVLDGQGSSTAMYLKDSLLNGESFHRNIFTLNTSQEVIDYVSTHPNALGFVGLNLISDLDDPKVKALRNKISIVSIATNNTSAAFQPSQTSIKTKDYPFVRSIYLINRQTRAGLGMGFVSFVAGEKGQLMLLKQGLVPNFQPERHISINTK